MWEVLVNKGDETRIDRINLIYIIVSLLMIGMSGRKYNHYGIIIIPLTIIPISRVLGILEKRTCKKELILTSAVFLLLMSWPWFYDYANRYSLTSLANQSLEGIISEYIKDNTEEDDLIIQCGHKDVFYVLSDRRAASKYSYPLPIAMIDTSVYEVFFEQLTANRPVVVITDTWTEQDQLDYTEMNRRVEAFLKENNYIHGPSIENYTLYYAEESKLAKQFKGK